MLETYDLLLFLHISAVILWVGAGTLLHVLAFRADRAEDAGAMSGIFDDLVALSNTYFVPASLLVLASGILLVIDTAWTFGALWIVLGLAGWALTFLTGTLWIAPQSKRVQSMIERDGRMGEDAYAVARRMLVFARLDYVVLFLIVFDMVVKPTGDDTGILVLMGSVLAVAAAFLLWRARSIDVPGAAGGA